MATLREKTKIQRGYVGWLAFVSAAMLASCGEERTESPSQSADVREPTAQKTDPRSRPPQRHSRSTRRAPEVRTADRSGDEISRGQPRTLPNGTVIIPPLPPTQAASAASDICASQGVQDGGPAARAPAPPRPGLRAELGRDVVNVYYDPGDPPGRCRPDYIHILVDVNNDALPPLSRTVRLTRPGERKLTVPVPEFFDSMPDVARATTGTDRGQLSPTARVRISA